MCETRSSGVVTAHAANPVAEPPANNLNVRGEPALPAAGWHCADHSSDSMVKLEMFFASLPQ